MEVVKQIENIGETNRENLRRAISHGNSTVQKFYDDAVVFVTGASGFLGRQLVEKILSSTNVKTIFILLRPWKGKNVEQRFRAILDDPVYEFLHKKNPDFINKIIPIEGDVSNLSLGIDDENWLRLIDEVDIIFHSAATVNFDNPLKKATLTNVRGTREILRLAKSCKHLKSIVHVSTAYSNATKSRLNGEVKEDFYASPIPPDALIQIAEHLEEDKLENIMKSLMSDWPNSYAFTKAVTEDLVRTMAEDLPLCIIRPAIVISAYREPSPGWVDVKNAFGPSGIILGISVGLLHTIQVQEDIKAELVPVDIVNNAMIVAAYETFTRYNRADKQTTIYTITTARNRYYFRTLANILKTSGRQLAPSKSLWYCFSVVTPHTSIYNLLTCVLHYIPAAVVDGVCVLIGEKPRLLKIYKLVSTLNKVFTYFLTNQWNFHDGNTVQLYNKLSDVDKEIYKFNMADVDMHELTLLWVFGVKKYIIKDDLEKSDYALKKQFWLKIAHYTIFPLYLCLLFKLPYFIITLIYKQLFNLKF